MAQEYFLMQEKGYSDDASEDTQQASNEATAAFTTIRFNLEMKVKTHQEILNKIHELIATIQEQTDTATSILPWNTQAAKYGETLGLAKLPMDAGTQKKYVKDFRWFDPKTEPQRFYVRVLIKVDGDFSECFLSEAAATLNSFDKTPTGGWVTHFRALRACSDAINPHILCYLVNISEEAVDSEVILYIIRTIGGDHTLGLKFAPANVPKNMKGQVSSPTDWQMRRVAQVEGERATGAEVVKRLSKYLKVRPLLGSRVVVVDLSSPSWAKQPKVRRAFKEGVNAQVLLNQKLMSIEMDDVKLFSTVEVNGRIFFLAQLLMQYKATKAVMMKGTVRKVPLFHSMSVLGPESAVLHYLPHSEQEATSIAIGFPVWMESVLGICPIGYCSSAYISFCKGGTWDKNNGLYSPPAGQNNILEFVEIDVTQVQETFLSTQENNMLAREEDELTEGTKIDEAPAVVNGDNISLMSNNTDNTATLTEKNRLIMKNNLELGQQVRMLLELAQKNGLPLPKEVDAGVANEPMEKEGTGEVAEGEQPAERGKEADAAMEGDQPAAGGEEADAAMEGEQPAAGGEEADAAREGEDGKEEAGVEQEPIPAQIALPPSPQRRSGVEQGMSTSPARVAQAQMEAAAAADAAAAAVQEKEDSDEEMISQRGKPNRSPRATRSTPAKSKKQAASVATPSPVGVTTRERARRGATAAQAGL